VPPDAYPNWTDLKRFTVDRAVAEVNHLSHFTVAVGERRQGRRVTEVTLAFEPKSPAAMDAAADELNASRIGRKARRRGQVETVLPLALPAFDGKA
jgi:plasmid replication initiation protein